MYIIAIVLSFVIMAMFSCKKEVATLSIEQSHIADSMALVKADSFYVPYFKITKFDYPESGETINFAVHNCKSAVLMVSSSYGGWAIFNCIVDGRIDGRLLYCDWLTYKFVIKLADGTSYETQQKEYWRK